ncbi:MAG: PPC domain-containing protein [Gemmatimonadales bacterium]
MRSAFILTALVAVAATARAQIPIRLGQSLTGRLVQSDQKFSDGSRYKLYAFVGNKGDTVAVNLTSDDFDANLLVADASGNSLARNDDSGEKCNARLTFVPPATGNYRIYANSSAQAELGEYHIALARGHATAAADTVCRGFGRVAGLVEVGQTITGDLTSDDPEFTSDSTYFQRWVLPVKAFQAFTVDLLSDDFDAYLILTHGRGEKVVENDDGGGSCNARLVYTAQDDHPLRVVVNTASRPRRQTGHYTLRVTEGEATVETKGNCRFTNSTASTTQTPQATNVSQPSSSAQSGSVQSVRVGDAITGSLTSNDSLYPDNSYFRYYQFTPTPNQPVTIDLSSDDFDPVLIVRGDDLDASIINDDGGPGCSSRISRSFASRGPYRILVNTTANPERQTGRFSLSITQGTKPVQDHGNSDCQPPQAASGGSESGLPNGGNASSTHAIDIGQTQQGSLSRSDVLLNSDSTYAQPWTIQGRAGQTITIDLESDAFDSYLFLRGPGISGGRDFQDDDSGGNCHARLTATFPQTGEYEVVVNTADHYATGAFTLSVTSGSKPKSVARCSRSSQ